jgi:hypothetical protein
LKYKIVGKEKFATLGIDKIPKWRMGWQKFYAPSGQ